MFTHPGALRAPHLAERDKAAKEIIRLWVSSEDQHIAIRHEIWNDPAAWGLCLCDIARHVARAFAQEGGDEGEAFDRIIEGFQIELQNPTDEPSGEIN